MRFTLLVGTFLALCSSIVAAPSPQLGLEIQCLSTCSTDCVAAGLLQGGLCSADGTCTCLTGIQARNPEPSPQAIECLSTCSTNCVNAGSLRGGLCSADGTCTCLTGFKKREAEPQSIDCYTTCSVDCINAGYIEGGICDAAG